MRSLGRLRLRRLRLLRLSIRRSRFRRWRRSWRTGRSWGDIRTENAALGPVGADELRVVFYGDSITDGWGRRPDTGEFFPGKPYVNRGISGQTTPQMVVRFRQDVIDLQPAAVVILAGTNDIAGNTGPMTPEMTEDNFRSMIDLAQANGIRVIVARLRRQRITRGGKGWRRRGRSRH